MYNIWFDASHIEAWLDDPNVSRVQGGTKVLRLYLMEGLESQF